MLRDNEDENFKDICFPSKNVNYQFKKRLQLIYA